MTRFNWQRVNQTVKVSSLARAREQTRERPARVPLLLLAPHVSVTGAPLLLLLFFAYLLAEHDNNNDNQATSSPRQFDLSTRGRNAKSSQTNHAPPASVRATFARRRAETRQTNRRTCGRAGGAFCTPEGIDQLPAQMQRNQLLARN